MIMPNFLILGTPKAGTTSIYNYLNQHPQIYLPSFKEPHFFSYEGEKKPQWGIKSLEAYSLLFDGVTRETAIGEASTWYLYSHTAAKQIRDRLPKAKLIAILRNPMERAYSSWAFRVQCGWESIANFEQAIQAEASRRSNNWEWDFHYLQAGFYYKQIKRYYDLFPKEQVRVYLYEDLKANPTGLLQIIYQFLNVDDTFTPDISIKHNTTSLPRFDFLNLFLTQKSKTKDFFKTLLPYRFRQTLASQLRQENQVKISPLTLDLRQQLLSLYREDIFKLEDLLNQDLSKWLALD